MAKGKKGKKGKRRGDDSDSDLDNENSTVATTTTNTTDGNEGGAGLSRKQKRLQKLKNKQQAAGDGGGGGDDSDGNEKDETPQPAKKLTKKQLRRQQEREAQAARAKAKAEAEASAEADESEEEEEEPVKKLSAKELKKQMLKEASELKAREAEEAERHKQEAEERARREAEEEEAAAAAAAAAKAAAEEEAAAAAEAEEEEPQKPVKKLTKKQLKKQKEKEAAAARAKAEAEAEAAAAALAAAAEEESEESEEEYTPPPVKKLTKKQSKKQKQKEEEEAAAKSALFEESEEEEEDIPLPVKKSSKKGKKQREKEEAVAKAAFFEGDTTEEEEELAEELEKMKILEEKTSSKKKKDKTKKKSKLERQMEEAAAKAEEEADDRAEEQMDFDDTEMDEEAKAKAAKKAEKAKRKAEKEAKRARKAEKEAKRAAKAAALAAKEAGDEEAGEKKGDGEDEDEDEIFYGAPDDKAWTDKSHAQAEAEEKAKEGPDMSLIYGKDGKKLSNKERKRALKAKQAAERAAEYEATASKASAEGAQFACSQTAVNEKDPQWLNSLDINVPSFSISAAGKILFKDAAFNIGHGRRYGLVGANGRGKSTLLKMIASRDLKLPPRVDFLYVEQEVVADNTPAVDAVLKADKIRWDLIEEEKVLTKEIDEGSDDPKKIDRLQKIYDELDTMGASSSEAKARRILYGLGFDPEMQTKPTKMFSGGWRMRISLARALFIEPTLLMLDEPTNHLDLNAVIWLDDYLQRWKKTLLVVSHDQDFLNSVCEEILHIEDLKLISYKGDYDSFKKAEKTKLKQQQKAWEKQEKRLRELKRSGHSKAKASEQVKKSSKREPGARSAKKKNDAIASGSQTAEVTELVKRPREYQVKLHFAEVNELSRPVMEVNRVHFRYSPKHPVIFDKIDFGIDMDSRICVVGPNGAGKSTLLKLLTGEIEATKGEVRRNPRLRMGIYNQHFVDRLPMGKTPVEHLRDRFQDEDYQSVRNRLGKYGLEGHAHEVTMRDLSGGQKARVVLVELSLQRPHILLLDEPTNNLDIETIDALVDAINEFNGGIVVVTHDQRLIENCDCTLWVVEKLGVTKWDAGFDDYKETILRELEEQSAKDAALRKERLEAAAKARSEKLARIAAKMKK